MDEETMMAGRKTQVLISLSLIEGEQFANAFFTLETKIKIARL